MSASPLSILSLVTAGALLACGPTVSTTSPGLPGDGTANLNKDPSEPANTEPAEVDPWEGRELIEPPAAGLPAAVPLPAIERFTLKNGLQVIAVQDDSLPVTSFQVAVKAGKRHNKRELVGLADFTASMMTRGTRSRSAARIASEIEAVGGVLQSSASYEATFFSCKSLAKDAQTCFKVLPDVLSNPIFPESEVDLVRRNLQASVRQRLDDAGQLASAHFQSALWGPEHIRGTIMSSGTIDAIKRENLVSWHKQWMRPNNAILAISGQFDAKKLRLDLERSFGRWRKAPLAEAPELPLPKVQGLRIRLVDKPGQTQSHIRLGHLGIKHSDPDFFPTLVFNYTLGGGQFASRLMRVVRSAEGKAYTASSSFDRNMDTGAFMEATFTRTAETVATIKLIQGVVRSLASEGPSEEELRAAVTNIAGSYATRFETASDVASALLAADLHGFSDEYVSQYPLSVAAVSREQAAAAAARVLDPVNGVLVIVGDAKKVEPLLRASGWGYEVVPYTAPVSDWEREGASAPDTSSDDPEAIAAATKLLGAALAKKGGAAKLGKLKGFRWVGSAELNLPTGVMPAEVEKHFAAPDKLRLDMRIGGGTMKIATVLNGKGGWAQEDSPRGKNVREFTPQELQALSAQLWRDSELVLLRQLDKGIVIKPAGERTLDGAKASAIELSSADGSRAVTLLVDPKSKQLLGMDYSDQGMQTSERFSDYKLVKGIQVAHSRTTKGPQVDLKVELKSFEVNTTMPETLWSKP